MTNYALRLVAVLVALTAATRSGATDTQWLAVTVIVCTLVWTNAQVVRLVRPR